MENTNDDNKHMTNEEARAYIDILFDGYLTRKTQNRLYQANDNIPSIIINTYYKYVSHPDFSQIIDSFRNKYIYNENIVESVHERLERIGLRDVYNYIFNEDMPNSINLYTLLRIHQLLYSRVPYPEFGGNFRNQEVFLPNSGIEISNWRNIPEEMSKLYKPTSELLKWGESISKEPNTNQLISYINNCVDLKCQLIRVHPFYDGNGRSTRAFFNLMLRVANIPPVYIKIRETAEYHEAMNQANVNQEFSSIYHFYQYKVCDSIIEHDILEQKQKILKKY